MAEGKIKILSTKILKPEIISEVQKDGLKIEQMPFIKTSVIFDEDLRVKINALSELNIRAIFTSANAVEAVKSNLLHPPSWKIFCINGATLEAVKNYFPEQNQFTVAPDAGRLAELIKENAGSEEIWYFCGNRRLDIIPDALGQEEITYRELMVYNTSLVHHKVDRDFDGILFFSPSAALSFFNNNVIKPKTICFAFGPSTYRKLKELTTNTIIQNTNPDQFSMIGELKKYFSK